MSPLPPTVSASDSRLSSAHLLAIFKNLRGLCSLARFKEPSKALSLETEVTLIKGRSSGRNKGRLAERHCEIRFHVW